MGGAAGSGGDALLRVRRYMFPRFLLLLMHTRSCAFRAEAISH